MSTALAAFEVLHVGARSGGRHEIQPWFRMRAATPVFNTLVNAGVVEVEPDQTVLGVGRARTGAGAAPR